jgi:hypothetical protein
MNNDKMYIRHLLKQEKEMSDYTCHAELIHMINEKMSDHTRHVSTRPQLLQGSIYLVHTDDGPRLLIFCGENAAKTQLLFKEFAVTDEFRINYSDANYFISIDNDATANDRIEPCPDLTSYYVTCARNYAFSSDLHYKNDSRMRTWIAILVVIASCVLGAIVLLKSVALTAIAAIFTIANLTLVWSNHAQAKKHLTACKTIGQEFMAYVCDYASKRNVLYYAEPVDDPKCVNFGIV